MLTVAHMNNGNNKGVVLDDGRGRARAATASFAGDLWQVRFTCVTISRYSVKGMSMCLYVCVHMRWLRWLPLPSVRDENSRSSAFTCFVLCRSWPLLQWLPAGFLKVERGVSAFL